ncbi:MAG: hypothetical protein ACI3WT_06085 [Phascolarctobacterium sp.]
MVSVLEKQLALALDRRLSVFMAKAADGSLLEDEMALNAAAYMASEIIQPCCCMLCNKEKLAALLKGTSLCRDRAELITKMAELIYHDLARCNGLG